MFFAHAAPKHKKTQCFLILLAIGEQSGAKSVLRDSGSGGGPIGRKTFESKPPVQAKQQVLKN